jgi:hypothetical protein
VLTQSTHALEPEPKRGSEHVPVVGRLERFCSAMDNCPNQGPAAARSAWAWRRGEGVDLNEGSENLASVLPPPISKGRAAN